MYIPGGNCPQTIVMKIKTIASFCSIRFIVLISLKRICFCNDIVIIKPMISQQRFLYWEIAARDKEVFKGSQTTRWDPNGLLKKFNYKIKNKCYSYNS